LDYGEVCSPAKKKCQKSIKVSYPNVKTLDKQRGFRVERRELMTTSLKAGALPTVYCTHYKFFSKKYLKIRAKDEAQLRQPAWKAGAPTNCLLTNNGANIIRLFECKFFLKTL
jgi:hypothetical protein